MKKPTAVKIVEALGWAYVALAGASTRSPADLALRRIPRWALWSL